MAVLSANLDVPTAFEALSVVEKAKLNIPPQVLREITRNTLATEDPRSLDMFTAALERSCATFAQEILTGPPEWPYEGKFLIGPHHEEWDDLLRKHLRLCILAPRDHSKCPTYDSLLLSTTGERIPAGKWSGGYLLAYNEETHALEPAWSPASKPNGKCKTLRITTRTGRTETVNTHHPFRLWDRWVAADKLEVGQRIAVPKEYPELGQDALPLGQAWLLGVLVGDGCFLSTSIQLTKNEVAIVDSISSVASAHGWQLVPAYKGAPYGTWRLKGAVPWAREHDLMGKGSYTKRVPRALFTASKFEVSEFISGYLDTDAHVSTHGGGSVCFYSVAKNLLRDVQHLLVRLGVVSVLTKHNVKYKGELRKSWALVVRGKSICQLNKVCRPRGKRGPLLSALALAQSEKLEGGSVDLLPKEVVSLIQHSEDWFRKRGLPRFSKQYDMTRTKAKALAIAEGNLPLLLLAEAPVLWDEVVSIEDAGEQETYAIQVPERFSYCANDIVQHNTFFFDFAYPLWKAATVRNGIGYIFSATQDQAIRILGDIKGEVENNPKLQHLLPSMSVGKTRKWTSTAIQFANGHKIYARGFGTKVRGAHPSWLIVDDGLNDETAYSELVRKKQIEYFYTAISNMIVPGGQIIVVGTPFSPQDLYGDLSKNSEYHFQRYQALNGPDETPLWPARYSKERLKAKQREIGALRFTREFQCLPLDDDASLFPSSLFKGEPTEQFAVRLGMPHSFWEQAGVTAYIGVDFAMSSSAQADYMVIWVMGLDKFGNRWIMDIQRGKGLPYQTQLSMINDAGRKYQPALVFLEANQMQRIFGDELIRTTDLPIRKFVTTAVKHALDKGVPSLRVLLENRKFRIPRGDQHSIEMTDSWIEEMRSLTWSDGQIKSVAQHDDQPMACWICDQAIRAGGFSFDFGDDVATPGDLDAMLKQENDDTATTPVSEDLKETESRIRAALGIDEPESASTSGNLVDDDELRGDNPFDVGGAPSPDTLRNFW